MPSHAHAIIAFSNTGKSINTIVSNVKRFIAYDLVDRLQQQNSSLIERIPRSLLRGGCLYLCVGCILYSIPRQLAAGLFINDL